MPYQQDVYTESDADDEYDRNYSPVGESDNSPVDEEPDTTPKIKSRPKSQLPKSVYQKALATLPSTQIDKWTAEQCAGFIVSIGMADYAESFFGTSHLLLST